MRTRSKPRSRRRTRSSSWTTTPAPGARSASTGARPTPCTMRACRSPPGGGEPWPRSLRRRPHPSDGRIEGKRGEDQTAVSPRVRGLEVDLPSGVDLPEGLQGHLARPRARHDEQRAVAPPPDQGEAPRAEADLHLLLGRDLVLPVRPAHAHRDLPDVLLP